MDTIANGTEVSVEGYLGKGTIIERIEGGYVVRGIIPGIGSDGGDLLHEAPVSEYMVTPVTEASPAIGTTYLDRITGTIYRLRGYSNYGPNAINPSIAIQYADGAMSSARNMDISDLDAFEMIWESRYLTRGR